MKKLITVCLLVVALFVANAQAYPEMIKVEGGTFDMGSNSSKAENDEKPIHSVTVTGFSMSKYEVTVAKYKDFCKATRRSMPKAPSWGWNDKHPMVNITFEEANDYCQWLSVATGINYRLPTEAEWEYAARGGNHSRGYTYAGSNEMVEVGWNYGAQTQPGGSKKANELGLYDMSGNAWEWCKDWYGDYGAVAQTNPKGPVSGFEHVLRGGCWLNFSSICRVTNRSYSSSEGRSFYNGFRVVSSD